MSIDFLSYKIEYLNKKLSPAFRFELEQKTLSMISKILKGMNAPEYVKNCLLVDLLYPCIKHHLWINHSFFLENLHQHLMERYRIERGYCFNLIQNLTHYLNKMSPPPNFDSLKTGDESFITYIFIMTMSSTSEGKMLEEIGLGPNIFKKISDAIKSFAFTKKHADDTNVAVSDDEIVFHQVIEKISQERAKAAWYLDSNRIRYLLAKSVHPFNELFWHDSPEVVEELLIKIGQGMVTFTHEAVDFLKKKMSADFLVDISDNNAQELLYDLKEKGLLIFSFYSPVSQKETANKDKLLLSDLAYDLTAIHYASICKDEEVIPEFLLSLSPSWQRAVLCRNNDLLTDPQIVKQLITLPLAPSSIELLMSFIPSEAVCEDHEFFEKLLQDSFPAERRASFCRAIGRYQDPELILSLLNPVAKHDRSKHVRAVALDQLRQCKRKDVEELIMQFAKIDLGAPAALG